MSPAPSRLKPRSLGNWNEGITVEANQDTECFSIRQGDDLIHFCDWPSARTVIDQFMAERAAEA